MTRINQIASNSLCVGNDVYLPRLVLGGNFGERSDKESFALLDSYVSFGGTAIETAHSYAAGEAERQIGRWLRSRGGRYELILIDKCGHFGLGETIILDEIRESLYRIGTDRIDVLLLHRDDASVPITDIVAALHACIEGGLIRAWGVSNWRRDRIEVAIKIARERNLSAPSIASLHYSLATQARPPWPGCRSADETEADWLETVGIPLLSWSALAGGWLTDRPRRPITPIDDVYDLPVNAQRRDRARALAAIQNATTAQIALAFALSRTGVAATVGPQTVDELLDCLGALSININSTEREWLLHGESKSRINQ
jgi:1-deoxyxylulose-5-phosphate synthase